MRVLFNKGIAATFQAVRLAKQELRDEIHIVLSHSDPYSVGQAVADEFLVEPEHTDGDDYVAWLVDVCERRRITHFWPQRGRTLIARSEARFAAVGTKLLLPATADVMEALDDKARTYALLPGLSEHIPTHFTVSTAAAFREAAASIAAVGDTVCVKPLRSTYGHGFRVIDRTFDAFAAFMQNDVSRMAADDFAALLDHAAGRSPFLVMPFLDGPEQSIDCLAHEGRLVRHVARQKGRRTRAQVLMTTPAIESAVTRLTAALGLHGVFNAQVREHRGQLYLLEINARISGGFPLACESGVNLVGWALRAARGDDIDAAPMPRYGMHVAHMEFPVVLSS